MAQARKTIFSLGGPTYMDDPRVAEAQRSAALNLQAQAQQAAQDRALLEIDAENRRSVMESNARQAQTQAELLGRSRELDLRKYLGEQEIEAGDRRESMRYQGDRVGARERMAQALVEEIMRGQGRLDLESATRKWRKEDQGERQAWETEQARLDRELEREKIGAMGQRGKGSAEGDRLDRIKTAIEMAKLFPGLLETPETKRQRQIDAEAAVAGMTEDMKGGFDAKVIQDRLRSLQSDPVRYNALREAAQGLTRERQKALGGPQRGWPHWAASLPVRSLSGTLEGAKQLQDFLGVKTPGDSVDAAMLAWLKEQQAALDVAYPAGPAPQLPGAQEILSIPPLDEPTDPRAAIGESLFRAEFPEWFAQPKGPYTPQQRKLERRPPKRG